MDKYVTLIFLSLLSIPSIAQQIISLNEEDIDMTVLTWHYDRYVNSKENQWSVKAVEGVGYFYCNFYYNNIHFESIYDENGFILSEKEYIEEDRIPVQVIQLMDYRIVKYKISSFIKETDFEKRKETNVSYRIEATTKTGGVVVFWFDQDLKIIPENKNKVAIR